jgi:hypothetical protein
MHQIIEQDLELDRIPQAAPGATKDPIDKLPPQLTQGSFNALAHLTEEEFPDSSGFSGDALSFS